MAEPTRIEEVSERVRDFTKALRQAGAEDIAHRIDAYATGFVDGTQVRRSVDAIRQQLRYFRAYPEELPDLPIVQIAANRLEDACKEALQAEQIAPARPSLRAHGKRKLTVVLATLITAAALSIIPIAVAMAGIDVEDMVRGRYLPNVQLPKGSSMSLTANVLEPSVEPRSTLRVELKVGIECPAELVRGASCRASGELPFGSHTLPAFEVLLPDQAYGLHVGFGTTHLIGAVGSGEVWVKAGPQTPEGQYVVPLTAAFVGYAPAQCNWYLQLLDRCVPARVGAEARHEGVRVPTLRVDVVAAGPALKSLPPPQPPRAPTPGPVAGPAVAAPVDDQTRHNAEQTAQLSGAMREIRRSLDDAQAQLRHHRYDVAAARLDALARAFEPLDALAVSATEGDALPGEVVVLRARFEAARRTLAAFHERAFEAAYNALSNKRPKGQSDARVLAGVAHKLGISPQLLDQIYAEHAEQRAQREQRAAAAKQAADQAALQALLRQCGPLPKTAWQKVREYLGHLSRRDARVRLHECLTPRLSPKSCWNVVCDFDEITSEPGALFDKTTARTWTFRLQGERVTGHADHRVEAESSSLGP
ncbi:MAG: hypothetical protein ABW321_11360 [Polyangiales bacterium]